MQSRILVLVWCGLVAAAPCRSAIVTDYGFPISDPLAATVVGTPPEFQADLPEDIPLRTRELLVFRGRDVPDLYWFAATLRYAVAAQPGPAPLAFVIPGTGAGYDASRSLILQRALYQAGHHVVALPSPLHPNFIVSASTSRRPGLLAEDTADLYRVMALIRGDLEQELAITRYDLAGYSLGATNAAFVAKLDEERHAFDFDRVLLINPPVNLYRAAGVLDAMFEEHIPTIAAFNALFDQLMAILAESVQPGEPVQFSEDMVYGIYQRRPPPDSTLEALIGAAFRFASMNLLFTSDVMADAGVMVAPGHSPGITTSLTPYFKAATQLSFADYANRVVYPYYRQLVPGISFDQLVERESLYVLDEFLRTTTKIGLMHNADDFLLSRADLEFLERVFGDRARIFPIGGHCGNMAYRDNVAYLIEFFTGRGRH
jgi:hypothetical protein